MVTSSSSSTTTLARPVHPLPHTPSFRLRPAPPPQPHRTPDHIDTHPNHSIATSPTLPLSPSRRLKRKRTQTLTDLPPDLVLLIADYLIPANKHSLANLSATSRSLRRFLAPVLFKKLVLKGPDRLRRFVAYVTGQGQSASGDDQGGIVRWIRAISLAHLCGPCPETSSDAAAADGSRDPNGTGSASSSRQSRESSPIPPSVDLAASLHSLGLLFGLLQPNQMHRFVWLESPSASHGHLGGLPAFRAQQLLLPSEEEVKRIWEDWIQPSVERGVWNRLEILTVVGVPVKEIKDGFLRLAGRKPTGRVKFVRVDSKGKGREHDIDREEDESSFDVRRDWRRSGGRNLFGRTKQKQSTASVRFDDMVSIIPPSPLPSNFIPPSSLRNLYLRMSGPATSLNASLQHMPQLETLTLSLSDHFHSQTHFPSSDGTGSTLPEFNSIHPRLRHFSFWACAHGNANSRRRMAIPLISFLERHSETLESVHLPALPNIPLAQIRPSRTAHSNPGSVPSLPAKPFASPHRSRKPLKGAPFVPEPEVDCSTLIMTGLIGNLPKLRSLSYTASDFSASAVTSAGSGVGVSGLKLVNRPSVQNLCITFDGEGGEGHGHGHGLAFGTTSGPSQGLVRMVEGNLEGVARTMKGIKTLTLSLQGSGAWSERWGEDERVLGDDEDEEDVSDDEGDEIEAQWQREQRKVPDVVAAFLAGDMTPAVEVKREGKDQSYHVVRLPDHAAGSPQITTLEIEVLHLPSANHPALSLVPVPLQPAPQVVAPLPPQPHHQNHTSTFPSIFPGTTTTTHTNTIAAMPAPIVLQPTTSISPLPTILSMLRSTRASPTVQRVVITSMFDVELDPELRGQLEGMRLKRGRDVGKRIRSVGVTWLVGSWEWAVVEDREGGAGWCRLVMKARGAGMVV